MDDTTLFSLMLIVTLVIFVVIESRVGLKQALSAAVGMSVVWVGISYFVFGDIDWITGVEVALLVGMAAISWKTQSAVFFKFQPVIVALVMAVITLGSQVLGNPILVAMVLKYVPKLAPAQAELFQRPEMLAALGRWNFWSGIFFLVHVPLLIWSALKLSSAKWAFVRIVGFYVLQIIGMFIAFAGTKLAQ